MEVLVAVTAFAGALLAVIAVGSLVSRLREEVTGWLIAWTVTAAALCLSLGVVAIGHLAGFGPATFRIYQVTGALLAPLWLAVGAIQLLSRAVPGRFASWLFAGAFTVIGLVIMIADPVSATPPFGRSLPVGDQHWDLWPQSLLDILHLIIAVILVVALILALRRARDGDDYDLDNRHALAVLAPVGVATLAALQFSVPGIVTAGLLSLLGGSVWYVVARPLAPYEDEDEEEADEADEWPERRPRTRERPPEDVPVAGHRQEDGRAGARHAAPPGPQEARPAPPPPPPRRGGGLGDLVAEYRAGTAGDVDYAARMQGFSGPVSGDIMAGPPGGRDGAPAGPPQAGPSGPDFDMPATGVLFPGTALSANAGSAKPAPGIYGLLTVFTLMDGAGEAFDALAAETIEAIKRHEPDTLVFVCHSVKSAPLQRIIYELYRDETAYLEHQRQPHMERFASERVAHVLAANVIELNVNSAKVVPLPTAFQF